MEKILNVTGLHCKSCEVLLVDILSEIPTVSNVSVDYKKGVVKFFYGDENAIAQAKKAIEKEGYKVS